MNKFSQAQKVLEIELADDDLGNFNFMTNWNYSADDIDYYSPYDDNYGTGASGGGGSMTFCDHEWIDVGFNHPKFVCKKCDKDRDPK